MLGLAIEFSLVVAWFLWLYRKQLRERARFRRLPWRQMRFWEREGDGES